MKMVVKTQEIEQAYLKTFDENLEATKIKYETKSIEDELKELEEKFRDPNSSIESIIELQLKHNETKEAILLKLSEMSQVVDNLKASNQFEPNLTLDIDTFGQLYFNDFQRDPFKSQILMEQQPLELIQLCEFDLKSRFKLLYRASRDGFRGSDFHSKCDEHANTLTIFKASGSGSFIFGGFTSVAWESSKPGQYKSDANAFLFSLTNKDNQPCKMKIDKSKEKYAIYCGSEYGPKFGSGHDICIDSDSNKYAKSYSLFGHAYKHPRYAYNTNAAKCFLTGSPYFQLSEIEVYQKE